MPVEFRHPGRARRVRFLHRPNRYLARVRPVHARRPVFSVHVPNPGRMEELLIPGLSEGWVVPAHDPHRRTAWDLVTVRSGRTIVSIDSRIGNRIVDAAVTHGALDDLGSGEWRRECRLGRERFDFARLSPGGRPRTLLEVKSSNLRVGTTAFFPDAPTERGARQVRALAQWARRGVAAYVLFVVQRNDCDGFRVNSFLDPEFDRAVRGALRAGVTVLVRALDVAPTRVRWGRPMPHLARD